MRPCEIDDLTVSSRQPSALWIRAAAYREPEVDIFRPRPSPSGHTPLAVPPPAPSIDPVMSALAQMMSKLNEVSDRLDRVEGAKAQCSDASTEQRKGKRVEFLDELPSQPLENPRNVDQSSSSRTHNVNKVHINISSEEADAISGVRSGKVLVDPHTDHKGRTDPLEEKDDHPSPTIISEEDSKDEEAPDEESRAKPNPEV